MKSGKKCGGKKVAKAIKKSMPATYGKTKMTKGKRLTIGEITRKK